MLAGFLLYKAPRFVMKGLSILLKLIGESRASEDVKHFYRLKIDEFRDLLKIRAKHLQAFQAEWEKHNLDFLIMPSFPIPASPNSQNTKLRLSSVDLML